MEEHNVTVNVRVVFEVEDESGGESLSGPGPVFLAECYWACALFCCRAAYVLPVLEVGGAFDADAVCGRVEEEVVVVLYDYAGVCAGGDSAEVGPVFEVIRI